MKQPSGHVSPPPPYFNSLLKDSCFLIDIDMDPLLKVNTMNSMSDIAAAELAEHFT
jgi:hypothetical protein